MTFLLVCINCVYSGLVFTCGLNDAHQLGHGSSPSNAPPNYLAPKQVLFMSYVCTWYDDMIILLTFLSFRSKLLRTRW